MAHKEMTLVGRVATGKAPRSETPPKKRRNRPSTGARLTHDLYKKIRGRRGPSDPQTGDVPPGELQPVPLKTLRTQSFRKKPR